MDAVNNVYAWLFSAVPILSAIIGFIEVGFFYAVGGDYGSYPFPFFSVLAALAMNVILLMKDEKEITKSGNKFSKAIFIAGLFIVPVYLFYRANRLKHNFGYAFAWIASFVLSLFIY